MPHTPGEPILTLDTLSGLKIPRECRFELRRGEILGIAGLVGAGRTELLRCIFGLDPVRTGAVRVAGYLPRATPRARIRRRAGTGIRRSQR